MNGDATRQDAGPLLTLRAEKPAAGGRMIARHEGKVMLVAGAIPGELVRARIEKEGPSLSFATAVEILEPHPLRRPAPHDPRCGGAAYAHMAVELQRELKAETVRDALRRIARLEWEAPIPVAASPERGYRMRARLHVREGRIGFFLEDTHSVCDAVATGQLSEAAAPALAGVLEDLLRAGLRGAADVELSENVPGDLRALHVELAPDAVLRARELRLTAAGVTGLSLSRRGRPGERQVAGRPYVMDRLRVAGPASPEAATVALRRHARAFFQGNRFLLAELLGGVVGACPPGRALDLYSGVGLFGVALAAAGRNRVDAVEGHPLSAEDLRANAEPWGADVAVHEMPVERYLARRLAAPDVLILDPPRAGMTRAAASGAVALGARHIVFVACDAATFARDVRRFVEAGYALETLRAFDLFPGTAHVEVLGTLQREG